MSKKTLSIFLITALVVTLPITIINLQQQQNTEQHAAGGVTPNINGCQIFPTNNVFNTTVSALPVHPNSATYINYYNAYKLDAYFSHPGNGFEGFPYNIVGSNQPFVPVHFTQYASESDPGPYPIPTSPLIEKGSDHHLLVLDSTTCKLYEIDGMLSSSSNTDGSWNALGSGAIFDLNSNQLRPNGWGSADAAGLPMLPLLIRYDEVAGGQINHAIRFLLPCSQPSHVWPARHNDSCTSSPNAPPEGIRLRLKASVDISQFPPQSRVILTALKNYGMFFADQYGSSSVGNVEIAGVPDNRWDLTDLTNLNKIHFSDFEAVDESGLIIDPNSAQAKGVVTISPTVSHMLTPSVVASSAVFNVSVLLHGLGNAGDNANPNGKGNPTPLHQQRTVTITVFSSSNQVAATKQGNISFDSSSGSFKGTTDMGTLTNGSYLVTAKAPGYLSKQIPGIIPIPQSPLPTQLPPLALVVGDINNDNKLDILDYNLFISCYGSKQNSPTCHTPPTSMTPGADLNDDGTIDGADYNLFLRELSVQKGG